MQNRVTAMGYGGEPLLRSAVLNAERVIYLALCDGNSSLESDPVVVGFPHEYVYEYDSSLHKKLDAAFRESNQVELVRLWEMARLWEGADDLPPWD